MTSVPQVPLDAERFGCVSRPLEPGDATAVVDLMNAYERLFLGQPFVELADITSDWQRPSFDIGTRTMGVFEGLRLIAYAELALRRAEVYVHPDRRGAGIGAALAHWTEQVARRDRDADATHDRLVAQSVPVTDEAAVALLSSRGYTVTYTSWTVRLPASVVLEPVELPAGVDVRPARPGGEDFAVWRVVEDAFNEWPAREPTAYEDWAASVTRRSDFAPWQLLVATEGTDIEGADLVGACFVTVAGTQAWVHQLAVRRDRRGLGLGRALLTESGRVSREHGASVLELSTDSRTGALGLYEHVGMVVTHTFEHVALPA